MLNSALPYSQLHSAPSVPPVPPYIDVTLASLCHAVLTAQLYPVVLFPPFCSVVSPLLSPVLSPAQPCIVVPLSLRYLLFPVFYFAVSCHPLHYARSHPLAYSTLSCALFHSILLYLLQSTVPCPLLHRASSQPLYHPALPRPLLQFSPVVSLLSAAPIIPFTSPSPCHSLCLPDPAAFLSLGGLSLSPRSRLFASFLANIPISITPRISIWRAVAKNVR